MLTFDIEADHGLLIVVASRLITLADVNALWERVTRHPGYHQGLHLLVDVRNASVSELDPDAMRAIATRTLLLNTARRAYVVADDMQFGMVRMLGAFSEINHPDRDVRPFRDMSEARDWLLHGPEPPR